MMLLFLGNMWLIKANIFQTNQMINLKVNENKAHKIPVSLLLLILNCERYYYT
jgi:hypothetical protein